MSYHLGIDDSNNFDVSAIPRIFVGVTSNDSTDLYSRGKKRLIRQAPKESLRGKLGSRNYYCLLLPIGKKRNKKYGYPHYYPVIAAVEFARAHKTNHGSLPITHFDGENDERKIAEIRQLEPDLDISFIPRLDDSMYLVTLADLVAYRIFEKLRVFYKHQRKLPQLQDYTSFLKSETSFGSHLVVPHKKRSCFFISLKYV